MEIENLPMDKKIILFDGVCNLCDTSVQFIYKHDKKDIFRFVAIQSELGQKIINHIKVDTSKIDSIILYEPGISYHYKAEAALLIARELSGIYSFLGFLNFIPNGVKNIVEIKNNRLVSTNFNLSDTIQTEMTCWRYPIIQKGLDELDARNPKDTIDLKAVGNVIGKAVQLPQKDSTGKIGGTLYTTFIDLTEMKLVLVYKLDNSKIQKLDILSELKLGKKRKIKLE